MKLSDKLEIVTAEIDTLSHDGRGIARINGKTTFVSGALPGETVKFSYSKKRSQYDEAQVVEVITPSADRVEPKCAYFGVCGGCNLQHLKPASQLELKQKTLLEQLSHFGNLEPKELLTPLTGPIWGYRRKARLGVKHVAKKGRVLVGFREKNGRFLADMHSCDVLHESVGMRLDALSEMIESLESYREIPQIEVAVSDTETALIFRHLEPLSDVDLTKLIDFGVQNKFRIYLQSKGPDTVKLLYPVQEDEYLSYKLQGLDLQFHPTDFTQVNADINRQMVARAIELLDLQADDTMLDLFCGLGNFTLPLAQHCKAIVGIEGSDNMVKRASENAQHNSIENADFYCANLAEDIGKQVWAKGKYNKILLDPPRTGAAEIIPQLVKFKAEKILYISCNPATLARDAGMLVAQGYKLKLAGVMDMFPHTNHVEAMALFTK